MPEPPESPLIHLKRELKDDSLGGREKSLVHASKKRIESPV